MEMKTVYWNGERLKVEVTFYTNNQLAIRLINEDTEMPYAMATLNKEGLLSNPDFDVVLIRDYSENTGVFDALVEAGYISPTNSTVKLSPWVKAKIAMLTPQFINHLEEKNICSFSTSA